MTDVLLKKSSVKVAKKHLSSFKEKKSAVHHQRNAKRRAAVAY
jgi:hypothetical protein